MQARRQEMLFKVKFAERDAPKLIAIESRPMSCGCEGSLEDFLIHSYREVLGDWNEEETPLTVEWSREYREKTQIGVTTLRLVREFQGYGGPEEGGWWYYSEELEREFHVPSRNALRHRERLERLVDRWNEGQPRGRDGRWTVRTGPYVRRERPHYC
jgi:hypothetical protein